ALVRRDLRAPVDRPKASLMTDIREGIDFILGHPMLRTMILFWSIVSISLAPLVTALAVHITRDLALGDAVLGLILTAYGVGTVVGSLLASRATHRPVGPTLLGGTFVTGCMLVVVASTDQVPILLVVAAISGIAQTMVLVTYITVRTAYSPDALLGRIGSTARTISLGLQPVGLLAGGALIDLTNGSTTIAVMGVGLALVSLAFIPVGALRQAAVQPRSNA
nr:MFS transporter [Chloroflexota bacterium]